MQRIRFLVPILTAAALVSACGGGGGSSSPGPRVTEPQAPSPACIQVAGFGCVSEAEYRRRRMTIEDGHSGEADFENQWGLTAIRADRAYAQLELQHGAGTEPGTGYTAGLIDTGIDTAHPVFDEKAVTEEIFSGTGDEGGHETSHGTAVASVIAGRPSAAHTAAVKAARGVARGADIAMFAIETRAGGGDYVPISLTGQGSTDDVWADRITQVLNWSSGGRSLDFVNVSVGYKGIIEQYTEQELRASLDDSIAALAQAGIATLAQPEIAEKTVFVWAAGNAHGRPCDPADFTDNPGLCVDSNGVSRIDARSPEILPGLPARIAELRGHLIAVVAVAPDDDGDGDYEIAAFSNRCGIAADWCIAAPGQAVRAAYFGPHPDDNSPGARGAQSFNGTSVAAPMVTGGLVVLKHYFRNQVPNTELVARLFEMANKTGIYADSDVYGQGLMDLGAAKAPDGVTSIALGNTVGGPGGELAETRLALGGALGDGLARAFAGREIAAFDELGAPFWFPLGVLADSARGPSAGARLDSFMAPSPADESRAILSPGFVSLVAEARSGGPAGTSFGVMQAPPPGTDGGHLSLAGRALKLGTADRNALKIAAFSTEGMRGQTPVSGATLRWRPSGSPLGFRSGVVAERETVLGTSASGAFGRISGSSAFAGVEGATGLGAWRLGAGAEIGTVDAAARGGLLAAVSPLTTSAFALRAERKVGGRDTLSVSVGQPLRVEAGRVRFSIPVGRTKDGRVLRRSLDADLEPSGRQIDIAAQWRRPMGDGSEMRLGAGWSRQPGHDASADPDLSVLAGWRRTF